MQGGNRGQIIVLFVLALVVLIGLAAIGVDVAYWYSVRHELQRSADTGALAGASYFKETGYWSDTPGDTNMDIARDRAKIFATSDNVIRSPLDNNTEVFVSFPEHFKIYVGTERTVPLFFSRFFLGPTKTIRAYAVAEAFPVTEKVSCIVPWGIPAPWVDSNNDGQFNNGETFAWPSTPEEWTTYTQSHCNGTVTAWDETNHVISGAQASRDDYLCQGSLQVLKIGRASEDVLPGMFYGMDLSSIVKSCPDMEPTSGADFYGYLISHSCECDFTIDADDEAPLDTKTGDMVKWSIGPVAPPKYYNPLEVDGGQYYTNPPPEYLPSGFRDLLIGESLMESDPNAQWVDDGSFNGGHPQSGNPDWAWGTGGTGNWPKSPRIVKIPIYAPDVTYNGGVNTPQKPGKSSFTPLGFMGFWIQDIQYFPPTNGTIVGRFITVPGAGGSGPDPGPSGTPVLNIRLVE
jgi:hypothetical protein